MTRRLISSGSPFEAMAGYSRAVVDGDWIFVSGTTGYDIQRKLFPETVEEQAELALRVIADALAQADSSLADIVRVRVYLADSAYVMPVSAILGRVFADIRPANTTIICGFAYPEMKVEFEVTALKRRG